MYRFWTEEGVARMAHDFKAGQRIPDAWQGVPLPAALTEEELRRSMEEYRSSEEYLEHERAKASSEDRA